MEEKIKKYFKERSAISISTFEREALIPDKTLYHFLCGRRGISIENQKKVIELINKYSPKYFINN